MSETSVTYTRALPPAELADWEAEATGLPRDREYKRRHHGTFISPAMLAEGWQIDGGDGRPTSRRASTAGYERAAAGIHLTADAGVLQVRRIVARMLATETGRTSAEADRRDIRPGDTR